MTINNFASFKGGAPRDLPDGPSLGSPLNPLPVTPHIRLLSGGRIRLLAFGKLLE